MISSIRESKITKVISSYLAIQLLLQMVQPAQLFALTSGPSQPEFNSFTPIGTSDMVNLSSGAFNYNIPIMDVGGYPLNLAYDSGVKMDQESSWVGLGWNLNIGQINRQVRGIPDDFKGDELTYENKMKPNITVGVAAGIDPQIFGIELPDQINVTLGVNLKYNNYTGIAFNPSYGLSFDIAQNVGVGIQVETSAVDGVSTSVNAKSNWGLGTTNAGIDYNSNVGLKNFNLQHSMSLPYVQVNKTAQAISGIGTGYGTYSFQNLTVTPKKRAAFSDLSGTFSFSMGADIWGLDGEIELSAMGSIQQIKNRTKKEKAFGYQFTGYASSDDILDFNRQNDKDISKNTLSLPVSNYTFDLYTVQGQGAAGMFRPFRSQIGQINDEFVQDESKSFNLGLEIEPGSGMHIGANFVMSPTKSHTGIWNTKALQHFKQNAEDTKEAGDKLNYEPVYFKYIGEPRVDKDQQLFEKLGGYSPIAIEIGGSKKSFDKYADNKFRIKTYDSINALEYTSLPSFSGKFKRAERDIRNQSIQKISAGQLNSFYTDSDYVALRKNLYSKSHHTAEMRVLNADGSTYVFGETAYNKRKREVTFTTNSRDFDCAAGEITYNPSENSTANESGIDHFFNAVETPAYAHTYLLSSVLSSDYEDLTGDGPSDDDLGSYTNFIYKNKSSNYKWRIPFGNMKASYDAGLNSNPADQKGSYIYGEKEIKYIEKVITKTHIAVFHLSNRNDGRGVIGENGGGGSTAGYMQKLDSIALYSKPEYAKNGVHTLPIKTAHFVYDYSQCKGIENNLDTSFSGNELSNDGGKLTLKKVYFTYRGSHMGKYTPYTFHYDGFNPNYNLKSYDIWGNYKPNEGTGCNTSEPITVPEFPYVQQVDRALQDQYTSAWSLTAIDLPSGGKIDLQYESDDYRYVQNRPALQMFKVAGAGNANGSINQPVSNPHGNHKLYKFSGNNEDAKYLYVQLPAETDIINPAAFKRKYLKEIDGKPMYFRFLMNMTKSGAVSSTSKDFDYVTGYLDLDKEINVNVFKNGVNIYAALPMNFLKMEGGTNGGDLVNPISKAGWYFGRQYLNGLVYGINSDYRTENIQTIAKKVVSSFAAVKDIFTGPNKKLRGNEFLCAQRFIPQKSWIRLSTPDKDKMGGGSRIKTLSMKDHWGIMVDPNLVDTSNRYEKEYGQQYEYTLTDGSSSGVATYEPNMSKENPFVEPFYDIGEKLVKPREISYVEKPFGEGFFPAATVTYRRVTVKNIERDNISKHATGKVVSEFFTSKDYPTIVDYTDIDSPNNFASTQDAFLKNFLRTLVGGKNEMKNEYSLSQGFVVHTNDMNGKLKTQKVYAEEHEDPISSVLYKYNAELEDEEKLNNSVPVIYKDGTINSNAQVGVDYDIITDFRESYSKSETKGYNGNLVVLFIGPFPVPVPTIMPNASSIENVAHSTITTKVIHTTAILKEKVAMDLGSKVSTINEAWDAQTGQVLLTRTVNEFDDEYYNFNFPAYWSYADMGQASKNIGMTGELTNTGQYFTITNAKEYFTLGDELIAKFNGNQTTRLWVVGFNGANNGVTLMNRVGQVVNKGGDNALTIASSIKFRVVRSGYRNQQFANMASITMMKNPIKTSTGDYMGQIDTNTFTQNTSDVTNNLRIVNASAVAYHDFWNCQCESELEYVPEQIGTLQNLTDISKDDYPFEDLFNPYVYNVKGEWRAKKSYAHLTERTDVTEGISTQQNTRREGYFKNFTPFYNLTQNEGWKKATNVDASWTFASEVTQYSSLGAEVENRDALNRFSSAQYGYNYTLPTAVSSNSRYAHMGADNFEDYDFLRAKDAHFTFRDSANADGYGNIRISENLSHTGRTSLLIPPNDQVEMERQLIGEYPEDLDFDNDGYPDKIDKCPYVYDDQSDYDDDGIGDACDDDPIPQIANKVIGKQTRYWMKRSSFTIYGNPNETVPYEIRILRRGNNGLTVWLDSEIVQFQDNEYAGELLLDVRGQRNVKFEVQANKDGDKGRVLAQFALINTFNNTIFDSTAIRICPKAFNCADSGNGDSGSPAWNCD